MSAAIVIVLQASLGVMIVLMLPCAYRVALGPTPADRLQAVDTITTLLIGIVLLLTMLQGSSLIIDVGIALAAFGFIATLAIARFIAEGRVF